MEKEIFDMAKDRCISCVSSSLRLELDVGDEARAREGVKLCPIKPSNVVGDRYIGWKHNCMVNFRCGSVP